MFLYQDNGGNNDEKGRKVSNTPDSIDKWAKVRTDNSETRRFND